MAEIEYRIAPDLFEAYPGYCRGVVVIDAADNHTGGEALARLLRDAEAQVRDTVRGNVAEHPRVLAWREAYRQFGAKPSEHRCSIEALVRRVVKPDALPSINPLVDIGNIVSLRHMLPAGVHPLTDAVSLLELRRSQPGDTFLPADGGPAETPPTNEIVLTRGQEVLTRRWTWRQAAGTQTLHDTTRVFFNIDGLPPTTPGEVQAAMQDCIHLIRECCGGKLVLADVLHAANPSIRFSFG